MVEAAECRRAASFISPSPRRPSSEYPRCCSEWSITATDRCASRLRSGGHARRTCGGASPRRINTDHSTKRSSAERSSSGPIRSGPRASCRSFSASPVCGCCSASRIGCSARKPRSSRRSGLRCHRSMCRRARPPRARRPSSRCCSAQSSCSCLIGWRCPHCSSRRRAWSATTDGCTSRCSPRGSCRAASDCRGSRSTSRSAPRPSRCGSGSTGATRATRSRRSTISIATTACWKSGAMSARATSWRCSSRRNQGRPSAP